MHSAYRDEIRLYGLKGAYIPNRFHFTIYTSDKLIYSIAKYLKDLYKTEFNQYLEVNHLRNLDYIKLQEDHEWFMRSHTGFCHELFEIQESMGSFDMMIVLTRTSKDKTQKEIAGYCLMNTYFDNNYYQDNPDYNWIAAEIKYLCSFNLVSGGGSKMLNLVKLFTVAMGYFNPEKKDFFYGLTHQAMNFMNLRMFAVSLINLTHL